MQLVIKIGGHFALLIEWPSPTVIPLDQCVHAEDDRCICLLHRLNELKIFMRAYTRTQLLIEISAYKGKLYSSVATTIRVSTLKDFFLFKEIFAIARKKQEIQNRRKYEGNLKKLKKIEKTLISANVALCNYLCNHEYSV